MCALRKTTKPKVLPPKPRIVGIGLITLDMVSSTDRQGVELLAGGTCGNIMAILAHLGWRAVPIARISDDVAGTIVKEDLAKWGVDVSFSSLRPTTRTPVIVEKIRKDRNNIPFHTFSFYCPFCGCRFPSFQPVPAASISNNLELLGKPTVLFVDRASKSSVNLANAVLDTGGVIVFEPPSNDHSKSFVRLLEIAHVVKYSHDRIDELPRITSESRFLEIQTLGRGGLRFRSKEHLAWQNMEAEPVKELVDAAGSGDWLTAGLLYGLYGRENRVRKNPNDSDIVRALALGQRLAAWNCSFRGARGGMYTNERSTIASIISKSLSGSVARPRLTLDEKEESGVAITVCMSCSGNTVHSERPAAGSQSQANQRA